MFNRGCETVKKYTSCWRSIKFGLVVFYGISTLLGYLMPNPVYTYILYIYDLKVNSLYVRLFLNEPELICLHTVDWFQVLLFIVCTQLNSFKFCNSTLISLFNINNLFAHS